MKNASSKVLLFGCLLIGLFLAGCVHSLQEMKANPDNHYSFLVDKDYQTVYKTIYTNSRECQGLMIETVQAQLFQDDKRGEISWFMNHGNINVHTEIQSVTETGSKVDVWYYYKSWRNSAITIEKWVKTDFKGCVYKEPSS